jgi:hypothetical protein
MLTCFLTHTSGAVEKWLLDVESDIRRTLHKISGEALEQYAKSDRSKWILEWPGQLVLNCSQVRAWTLCASMMEEVSRRLVKPSSSEKSLLTPHLTQ